MSENTLNVKIKQRYDTEANWETSNPVLLAGECAYSSDKGNICKTGDGVLTWSELPYNTSDKANTATNATKLYSTLNTTTGTYYLDYHTTASSANKALKHDSSLSHYLSAGTTSAVGKSRLTVGNSTASGTAGNTSGYIYIYGTGAYYSSIISSSTANRTHTLPDTSGTLLDSNNWGKDLTADDIDAMF